MYSPPSWISGEKAQGYVLVLVWDHKQLPLISKSKSKFFIYSSQILLWFSK